MNKLMILTAAAAIAVGTVARAASEFAMMSLSSAELTWTDAAGEQRGGDPRTGDLFSKLSGEARRPASNKQATVLLLDGLSRKGWSVVNTAQNGGGTTFILQRPLPEEAPRLVTSPEVPTVVGPTAAPTTLPSDTKQIAITFTGGHDTDPRDGGRPVILVAAALKVPPETFRDAFTHVHPAHNDGGPTDEEARSNKRALLDKLAPLGVTDDRLNEVSNYYRYRNWAGELWTHRDATAYAIVRNGRVQSVTITDGGAGYSSLPTAIVPGVPDAKLTVEVSYGEELKTNGAVHLITIEDAGGRK